MLKPEQVPEAVWRAAMSTYHKTLRKNPAMAWQAALVAALREWPGVLHEVQEYGDPDLIMLPLPMDGENAKS